MQHIFLSLIIFTWAIATGWAQGVQAVSGTVQTEAGTSLPGARVFFKGTHTGSSTNEEGRFGVKVDFSKGIQTLSISFIGYETQELPLSGPDNSLVVTLRPSAMLD